MALTDDHFSLFSLPVGFDVDKKQLTATYRELQGKYHPDRFANQSDEQRRFAQQTSAQINEAYQTLRKPLARGRYLLMLKGSPIDDAVNPAMDTDFLMLQLGLREKLNKLPQQDDASEQLLDTMDDIEADIQKLVATIRTHFSNDALDLAKQNIYKLHFLDRLQQDALALEEQLDD